MNSATQNPNQLYCVLDYETRSECDLKKAGAYEYANHSSTEILCASWAIGTRKSFKSGLYQTYVWSPFAGSDSNYGLIEALDDRVMKRVAHNAFFEQVITAFVLPRYLTGRPRSGYILDQWICTASQARALALPGKLEMACQALELPVQKDMEGHRLMLKMSKPRKATENNSAKWYNKLSDLKRLMEYCKKDVEAEIQLFLATPELSPFERKVWLLDQKINWRGFKVDRPLVETIQEGIKIESERFESETQRITDGVVRSTKQRDATLRWLESQGTHLPNLRKDTVSDALKLGLVEGPAFKLLTIRQMASKSSTAKYAAFEMRSRTDGRIRDNLVYHAASTGRWGGSGVQPQNFVRPKYSSNRIDLILDVLKGGSTSKNLDLIRYIAGEPMEVFASLLRSMIISKEEHRFIGGDYAGIELRVAFWLANHHAGLRKIREGIDLYCDLATEIFGRSITKLDKTERQLGKTATLGCIYQMGKDRFLETCLNEKQEITHELAEIAVNTFREVNAPVVKAWKNLELASLGAIRNPGKAFKINHTKWWVADRYLWCELPSGRKLAYYRPEIKTIMTSWGEPKATLHHYGVNPRTKKWELAATYGGRLFENITQATSRDLMAAAMVRVEEAGYPITLTVHDEIKSETENDFGSVDEFKKLMEATPDWAKGCPVDVEAWEGPRYSKT